MKRFFRLGVIIGTLPVTLTNGTTADATQVQSDLQWIVNQTNANAAPLSNTALLNANNNFTTVQSGVQASAGANYPIASQVQDWAFNTLTSTLGTNEITARVAQLTLSAWAVGQVFTFIPSQQNTGSVTLNPDGLGSGVVKLNGSQLVGGELGSGAAFVRVASAGAMPVLDLINPKDEILGNTVSTFTFNGSGGSSGLITMTWRKNGNWVNLNIPAVQATSGTGSTTLTSDTALPAAIRPTVAQDILSLPARNNGSGNNAPGLIEVGTNGILTIYQNGGASAFTDASSCGTQSAASITYFIG